MSFKKFIISILLAVMILPSLNYGVLAKNVITMPEVIVKPNVIEEVAEYKITFTLGKAMTTTDYFYIVFPADTLIPCSTCNPVIPGGTISVNGIPLTRDAQGNTTLRSILFYPPSSLSANSNVTIIISKSARIANPTKIGSDYRLQVSTYQEASVFSSPYTITYSTISSVTATLSSKTINETSAYNVTFMTGIKGALNSGEGTINIEFPEGTIVPQTISGNDILVNNKKPNGVKVSQNKVVINVPEAIKQELLVSVNFSVRAGITNPKIPGFYKVGVSTTAEPTVVYSQDYQITNIPAVSTHFLTTPMSPDGENDWFITSPMVVLMASSNTNGILITYYRIGNTGDFVQYTAPFSLPDGIYELYYYSSNTTFNLTEEVKKVSFKIDTKAPVILFDNLQEGMLVNSNPLELTGKVIEDNKNLEGFKFIAGKNKVNLNDDGSFKTFITLLEGDNIIEGETKDDAGNTYKFSYRIILDSSPPLLKILEPSMWQEIYESEIILKGVVEKGAVLSVNGVETSYNADGQFEVKIPLLKGMNTISIVAIDQAKNKTAIALVVFYKEKKEEPPPLTSIEIILQIGALKALVNGKEVLLDAAPYIDKDSGRTLVPLRFIAEAFGAKVDWDSFTRTATITLKDKVIKIQVGNSQAIVSGGTVSLDQPPVIKDGRTYVPVRFIAEAFGAEVKWIPETKQIKIIYKP